MNIAEQTLAKRTIAWMVTILVLLGGYISYEKLGRYEDPEFVIRQAVINTAYPGALPQQVAEEVTEVIEQAVQQLQELKEVTSVSRMGNSLVKVEIDLKFAQSKAELEQIWDKLRRKINDVQHQLPPGAGPSFVNDDFGDVYALFFAVTGEGYSLQEIKDYLDVLERELLQVPGVARVATLGEPQEAIFVEIASAKAAQLGVSQEDIYRSLRQQNVITDSGHLLVGPQRVYFSPKGQVDSVQALGNIALASASGEQVIFLRDIAEITRSSIEPPRALMHYDGQPAIGLGVSQVAGGNVVEMGDAVRARLLELESQRPVGIDLHVVSYQSDAVREAVDGFIANLAAAVAIVVLVLIVFMGWRSGVIVGIGLLLTVAGTLIAMYMDDIAMQRVSLGALIIALGMLVDNAIVVTDGILVRMEKGESAHSAANAVVKGTQFPLLGGTIVGILAFSAIGLSPTDMGEYAGSLFWVILYSMLFSWLFAVTLTPLLCVTLLKVKAQPSAEEKNSGILYRYRGLLNVALRHCLFTGVVMLSLLVSAILGFKWVQPGFMPDSARAQFVVDMYLPQGSDIRETEQELAAMAEHVRNKVGVTHITRFIGQGALRFMLTYSPEDPNSSYGQLLIDVEDASGLAELVDELQQELSERHPLAEVKVWKFMLGRGGGKKIEVAFKGPNPDVLRQLAEEAKGIMAADPGAMAVQDDWRDKTPVLRPVVDDVAARRAGVDITQISQALNRAFTGERVGVYREQDKLIPIIARAPLTERSQAQDLENVQVYSPTAQKYLPVGQLVTDVKVEWSDAILRRVDRFPTIKAQADPLPGEQSNPLLARIKPKIEAIELPPGYSLEWHGEYKASNESNEGLAISAPYGFTAMVLAVVLMFNALRQPLVIWLTAPLAIIGVTLGLVIFQVPFEFMAILGCLSLVGMLVKNSIVLVDQADEEIRAGKPGFIAVIDAAVSRARPVFLGALTTILGVAPLLWDPFFKSMAVVIMFGLAFATVLTLVVVPLLYVVVFRIPAK
ncbi:efflux RND transporter permease subunit [Denitrificimonas sp. JX-1]|uniref:Efflux RND transporter permease subunit n=1 Tax=Denitrificimonas halotolerans TaxID=3098930 RepID=A0ABU5GQK0_9GAMM|nr:efflux RND transporter permease subunit [Denitrificimonas sp. JX-1]MDY7219134.1 efflux RND transporter permease subunit [Denitrificimonas sp. JX-1]